MRAKVAYEILGKFKSTIQYSWLSFLLDAPLDASRPP